jgi:hypothetical protein
MKHFTRAACIIDTCSIINLDEIVLAKNDVLFYVRQFFDIHVSAIIRDEFRRHRHLATSREATYWEGVLSKRRYAPTVLTSDSTAIGPLYTTPPSFVGPANAGEHESGRIALELLLMRQAGHIIFVTDDEKACNAFLRSMRRSFPGVHLWTSVDVILYLGAILLKEKKADFDSIRAALRDVYAASAKKWEEIDEAQKSTIIRNQRHSVESLRVVQKVINHWRV